MKVFKFGGASVKDSDSIKNVAGIIEKHKEDDLMIVVSAMGKTTNALEQVVHFYSLEDKKKAEEKLEEVKEYHFAILKSLFEPGDEVFDLVNNALVEVIWVLEENYAGNFDYSYDQIVSVGEMLSTLIVSAYLNKVNLKNRWMDVRDVIKTDDTYREAKILWDKSAQQIPLKLNDFEKSNGGTRVITQGFIGVTSDNNSTTLGREGSDFSASILAYLLDSESVTVWKDVPGLLNADPKYFENTVLLRHISYAEAIELSYYGTSVIHPRTMKPIQNKSIPFYIKSFINPYAEGTLIDANVGSDTLIPSFIFKMNQVLLSISPKDYSFIVEQHLSEIFELFSSNRVRMNLMQNSALKFSACVDNDSRKLKGLVSQLQAKYHVEIMESLELITIRYYNEPTIDRLSQGKKIILEQKGKVTLRMITQSIA